MAEPNNSKHADACRRMTMTAVLAHAGPMMLPTRSFGPHCRQHDGGADERKKRTTNGKRRKTASYDIV
jgi:hypothetical protein